MELLVFQLDVQLLHIPLDGEMVDDGTDLVFVLDDIALGPKLDVVGACTRLLRVKDTM